MSGAEPDDAAEAVAAEYVLGTLDAAEAEAARARLELDRVFAAEVRFWEARLFPLTALVPPAEPPAALWARIEASTRAGVASPAPGPVAANDNRGWRWAALASMALAASLAAFIALRPAPRTQYAVLVPTGVTTPVLVAVPGPAGTLLLRPSGAITVALGRDLELWALAAGATRPVSLGVLPATGTHVPATLPPGTQLLVSVEPKGGSPTGQPTGAVVYGGVLRAL